jgi:catechol 2,3-dioxygenase-like lactoylglutathione lyase family enzyme
VALNSLLDVELAVPDAAQLEAFWLRRGLQSTSPGVLGTAERPSQLRLREGGYRHVSELRLGCDTAADLDDLAARLDGMGVAYARDDISVRCADPVLDHDVVVQIGEAGTLAPAPERLFNGPGEFSRVNRRSSAIAADQPSAPRRVGHVVFGSPDVEASANFYRRGIGMKLSDTVGGGLAQFLRCSTDHHNMLLMPAPVPCMNHYAVECNDADAIGRLGMEVVGERPEASVFGVGRHIVGSNIFWYLLDPAGGMFELFTDMDQITDDELWAAQECRDWEPVNAAWEPAAAKADFYLPADIEDIARGREAAGR